VRLRGYLRERLNGCPAARRPTQICSCNGTKPGHPTADAYEADGKFVVKAELPGVKQADITFRVEEGLLTIAAKRQEEQEHKEAQYHTFERFLGTVQRSFALPEGVETDKITARFADGMLEVTVPLPAQPPAKARGTEIPITG
jgi:HSP20 family protein